MTRALDLLRRRWLLLAGLGVSYVISGDYSGWNFGLEQGGFGGPPAPPQQGGAPAGGQGAWSGNAGGWDTPPASAPQF